MVQQTDSSLQHPHLVLCDLDGVVWLAHEPIPGSVEALWRLCDLGVEVGFVTNNSFSTVAEQHRALTSIGIWTEPVVLSSAMAAATQVQPGWRVKVCGGAGLAEAIAGVGATAVYAHDSRGDEAFDAVVVGLYREFDYDILSDASRTIRSGAKFIASNEDPMYPTPHGPLPGGGSIVAAIATAAGVSPVVTGKPHPAMATLVHQRWSGVDMSRTWMVGDRDDTDGGFARQLGVNFAHVLSGTQTTHPESAHTCGSNLAEVVRRLLDGDDR